MPRQIPINPAKSFYYVGEEVWLTGIGIMEYPRLRRKTVLTHKELGDRFIVHQPPENGWLQITSLCTPVTITVPVEWVEVI